MDETAAIDQDACVDCESLFGLKLRIPLGVDALEGAGRGNVL